MFSPASSIRAFPLRGRALLLLVALMFTSPLRAQVMAPDQIEGTGAVVTFRGIQIDKEQKSITFPATINMTEGNLEYLLVTTTGKTHESLLATKLEPYDIHVAMLLLGLAPDDHAADNSPPSQLNKQYLSSAPRITGAPIDITLLWKDKSGLEHRAPAETLIWNAAAKSPASIGPWTYNGSETYGGKFLAQTDGSIIALVRDTAALANNPRPGNDDDQIWTPYTAQVPPLHTDVNVTLKLRGN